MHWDQEAQYMWTGSFTQLLVAYSAHYNDVIMGVIAPQITSLTIVYSTVYSDADQRKHQSSTSLAFVQGIHRGPMNSLHKWPVTRKMFAFDDVIMAKPLPNKCCLIVARTPGKKLNHFWNTKLFLQGTTLEILPAQWKPFCSWWYCGRDPFMNRD